ncbi:unnamed protein product [Soboliphyme baturini]|uniref:DNA replication complex GINS protein PSF2 n=1 Tax=Soboliphyme baturini TaxID=241478 RepID=A0A183IIZ0_9BILA|nr:unnamed protein product [Soboliphyme baturini]
MDFTIVEFFAEKEIISIIPNFSHSEITLFSGNYGPFEAGVVARVPLWMALYLRQRKKCHIVPPEWMAPEALEEIKSNELESPLFTQLPSPHFMEISQLLLNRCPTDILHADLVKTLIQDIMDTRAAKLRTSMDMFVRSENTHAQVNHLTQLEICRFRRFLILSLQQLRTLQGALKNAQASQRSSL